MFQEIVTYSHFYDQSVVVKSNMSFLSSLQLESFRLIRACCPIVETKFMDLESLKKHWFFNRVDLKSKWK